MITRLRGLAPAGRPAREDDGYSLVEMLVSIIIFGIIGAALSAWFISGIKMTGKTVARNDDINQAHVAIQALTQDIEFAVPDPSSTTAGPFLSGSHDSMSMYTRIAGETNPNPAKVVWSVTGAGTYNATLVRSYYPPVVTGGVVSWPTTGTGVSIRTVLKGVNDKNDGKIPTIFRYLNATNSARVFCTDMSPVPTPCPATAAVAQASDPLNATDLAATDAVEIYLQTVSNGDGASSTVGPYFETAPKTGVPLVIRSRVFPLSNTITNTSP